MDSYLKSRKARAPYDTSMLKAGPATMSEVHKMCRGRRVHPVDPKLDVAALQAAIAKRPGVLVEPSPVHESRERRLPIHFLVNHELVSIEALRCVLGFKEGQLSAVILANTELAKTARQARTDRMYNNESAFSFLCQNDGRLNWAKGQHEGGVTLAMLQLLLEHDTVACERKLGNDKDGMMPLAFLCQNRMLTSEMLHFVLCKHPPALWHEPAEGRSVALHSLLQNPTLTAHILQSVLDPKSPIPGHEHGFAVTNYTKSTMLHALMHNPSVSKALVVQCFEKQRRVHTCSNIMLKPDWKGFPPLTRCFFNRSLSKPENADLVEYLFQEFGEGLKVLQQPQGMFPLALMLCPGNGKLHPDLIRKVAERHLAALLHTGTADGWVPLHCLCRNERVDEAMLRALLSFGHQQARMVANDGATPLRLLIRNKRMTVNMLCEFVRSDPNPMWVCLQVQYELRRQVRRDPARRSTLEQAAAHIRQIGAYLVRELPVVEIKNADGIPFRPFGYHKLMLQPELYLAAGDPLPRCKRGALALAVAMHDIDFLSASYVQEHIATVFAAGVSTMEEGDTIKGFERHANKFDSRVKSWIFDDGSGVVKLRWGIRRDAYKRKIYALEGWQIRAMLDGTSLVVYDLIVSAAQLIRFPEWGCRVPKFMTALHVLAQAGTLATVCAAATHCATATGTEALSSVEVFSCLLSMGMVLECGTFVGDHGIRNLVTDPFFMAKACCALSVMTAYCLRGQGDTGTATCFMAVATALACLLLAEFLQFNRSLGPLIRVVFSMSAKLAQFMVLLLILASAFGFALYFLLFNVSDTYETPGDVAEILFYAAFGTFDLDVCTGSRCDEPGTAPRTAAAQAILVMFITVTILMVLNLLVAVLSGAYAQVGEDQTKECQASWAKAVFRFQRAALLAELPSPLNIISVLPFVHKRRWAEFCMTVLSGLGCVVVLAILPLCFCGPLIIAALKAAPGLYDYHVTAGKITLVYDPSRTRALFGVLFIALATPPVCVYTWCINCVRNLLRLISYAPAELCARFARCRAVARRKKQHTVKADPWVADLELMVERFDKGDGRHPHEELCDELQWRVIGKSTPSTDVLEMSTQRQVREMARTLGDVRQQLRGEAEEVNARASRAEQLTIARLYQDQEDPEDQETEGEQKTHEQKKTMKKKTKSGDKGGAEAQTVANLSSSPISKRVLV
jgi:hypothetical protein